MRFDKDYLFPVCPAQDCNCPYFHKGNCFMYQDEKVVPYLECEYWEGSDEAEELLSLECERESAGW